MGRDVAIELVFICPLISSLRYGPGERTRQSSLESTQPIGTPLGIFRERKVSRT